ncbi:hypothetical protein J3R82DRAFT_3187 [Butyriboletus roseoflavus]|nr:hypothetical protein J3R82DRAFT_3187 [Butyriboletus roseoflavus]
MNPYYLNFTPSSQESGGGYSQTAQSVGQNTLVPSALLQGSVSVCLPTASQQWYPVLGRHGQGSTQALQMPGTNLAQSSRPPGRSGFVRTNPYHQARLRHIADPASTQHQGWSQLHFSTVPAPASGSVTPYNATISNRASARCHGSSQLPLVARKFAPVPAFGSAPQSNIVAPDMNQDIPSLMDPLMVPGQTFPSTYEPPSPPPPPPTDEGDIEYAQHRYGDKRCFYQCRFDLYDSPCNKWIVGERTRILRHLRNHHHLQLGPATRAVCRWNKCTHSRPMKQENLSRHVVMHLGVKWKCPHCRRLFSRDDAVHRHIERMVPGMDVTDAEVVPGREARAINESQFKRTRIA